MDLRITQAGQRIFFVCKWLIGFVLFGLLLSSGLVGWGWNSLAWFLGSSLWLVVKTGEVFFGFQFLFAICFYTTIAIAADINGNTLNQRPTGRLRTFMSPPPAYDLIQPPSYAESSNPETAAGQGWRTIFLSRIHIVNDVLICFSCLSGKWAFRKILNFEENLVSSEALKRLSSGRNSHYCVKSTNFLLNFHWGLFILWRWNNLRLNLFSERSIGRNRYSLWTIKQLFESLANPKVSKALNSRGSLANVYSAVCGS